MVTVKLLLEPLQIEAVPAKTAVVGLALRVNVTLLLVAVEVVIQLALEVITTVTTSEFEKLEAEYVELVAPPISEPFNFH